MLYPHAPGLSRVPGLVRSPAVDYAMAYRVVNDDRMKRLIGSKGNVVAGKSRLRFLNEARFAFLRGMLSALKAPCHGIEQWLHRLRSFISHIGNAECFAFDLPVSPINLETEFLAKALNKLG